MGKISTYATTTPELNDKLIGSDANSKGSHFYILILWIFVR